MSKNLMIGSILLAITAGCAVDASDEPQVSTIDEDIVVRCGPINFREEWYAEAAMINLVGVRSCTCFGTVFFSGTVTEFGRLHHKFTCDIR